jgi:molecular chaperone Hsp33
LGPADGEREAIALASGSIGLILAAICKGPEFMKNDHDALYPFLLQRAGVRGSVVRLESTWSDICAHADYSAPLLQLLGESLAASALFASTIKFEGSLSIQLRTQGPLRLLFAECSHDGGLRGIARWEGEAASSSISLDNVGAQLAITIENAQTETRYQGLVPVEGERLANAFEGYFERSEQLPTRIVLAQAGGRCAGMMLQQVASTGGTGAPVDVDGWNRVGHLLATLSDAELLELPVETLLLRLFHEEDVVLEPGRPQTFRCSCSPERVANMVRSLGEEEATSALDDEGALSITCEFCNQSYRLDRIDVAQLFATQTGAPAPSTPQ